MGIKKRRERPSRTLGLPGSLLPATGSPCRKPSKEEKNASLWKVEAGSSGLKGSLGYLKPHLKNPEVAWGILVKGPMVVEQKLRSRLLEPKISSSLSTHS